jgi:hypothetical protein
MPINYVDHFQEKIPGMSEVRDICTDDRDRPMCACSSWQPGRYSRKSGGGWPLLILVALVAAGLGSWSAHPAQSPIAALGAIATNQTQTPAAAPGVAAAPTQAPAAAPGTLPAAPTQAPAAAPGGAVGCADQPATGAPAKVALPDVVGQNAKTASEQLAQLGLTNVDLSSANPDYNMVIVASHWTVVGTSPSACTMVNSYDHVVLNVTKPSGSLRSLFGLRFFRSALQPR